MLNAVYVRNCCLNMSMNTNMVIANLAIRERKAPREQVLAIYNQAHHVRV